MAACSRSDGPMLTIAVAGDTMLGRQVGDLLASDPDAPLFDAEVRAAIRAADLCLVNLECCISDRGAPWPDPRKPFFFRAPPIAARVLAELGVDVVTLANNHALDYGATALLDTTRHLDAVGARWVGAGADVAAARRPVVLEVGDVHVGVLGATDHPADFAAGRRRPGTALWSSSDESWLPRAVASLAAETDVTIATVHWGPNMVTEPGPGIRRAARVLADAGASLVAGHSAHVFHGVEFVRVDGRDVPLLYDVGDLLDDYSVDPVLRNDLGVLWLVHVGDGDSAVEAVPLYLDHRRTRRATGEDEAWIGRRLAEACRPFGTGVDRVGDRYTLRPDR